ncbi:MAG: hypothetical protein Q4C70_02330, partial [Planctomycetia bacterium]|nr:hypothetical protein [Planctomycetia bacterium]
GNGTGNDAEAEMVAMESNSASSESLFGNNEEIPLKSVKAHQNVRLSIPTLDVAAAAETLEFHFPDQTLQLSGSQQTAIHFAQHEFHANHISYTLPPTPDQKFGTIHVNGNGWFRTFFTDTQNPEHLTPLTLHWRQELSTQIQGDNRYLINVLGNVEIQTPRVGKLIANQIQGQLRLKTPAEVQQEQALAMQMNIANPRQPVSKSGSNLFPDWVAATGNVRLQVEQETVQFQATLQEIQLQFEPATRIPNALMPSRSATAQYSREQNPSLIPGAPRTSGNFQNGQTTASASQRHFILKNAALHGKILLLPGKTPFYVSEMALHGVKNQNFHLYEERFFENSEQTISLQAQKVTLHDLLPETLQCEINGAPAILSGFGIKLESPKITVNCAANRIDISNAGKMHVYHRMKTIPNMNHSTLSETIIEWDKNLFFNGQLVSAQDNVRITAPSTALRADMIKALLSEPIQLNNPPKIDRDSQGMVLDFFADISAEQNVILKHQNYNPQNQLTDVFTVQTHYANFRPGTMDLNVSGKGALRLSHLGPIGGDFTSDTVTDSATSIQPESQAQANKPPEWFQIFIEYIGGISGNLTNGEFTIKDRISAIAHTVPDPGFKIPRSRIDQRQIPEKGFQFTCDQIYVSQIPTFQPGTFQMMNPNVQNIELKAEGNIHMENSIYSIDGNTLKYSQGKNTCSIYGTPQMPVHVTKQEYLGGRRNEMEAGSIEINLKSMRFNLDEVMIDGSL